MQITTQAIVAKSQSFSDIMALTRKVAASSCSVLITGESGTGKELIARSIHDAAPSRSGRYVPINVAALPSELVESQLFGHIRGAFTGATRDRIGAFRTAMNGTLLLDEIGDLPLGLQPKLLRALEQKEILPVGADTPVRVDTRVIAATSRNLEKMVACERFRSDLLFRLNVVQIEVPPLRERPEDIPILAEYYCEKFCRENAIPLLGISRAAMQCLLSHSWFGNVRELSHVIERAILLCNSEEIGINDLPPELRHCDSPSSLQLHEAVENFKRRHIVKVLEGVDGDRNKAAELLGLSSATLFRYIGKYGLKGYAVHSRHA